MYPTSDAWGKAFGPDYMPDRWKLGGRRICGPYIGIFDGVQADLEFVRKIFNLRRASIAIDVYFCLSCVGIDRLVKLHYSWTQGDYSRKLVCHYCQEPPAALSLNFAQKHAYSIKRHWLGPMQPEIPVHLTLLSCFTLLLAPAQHTEQRGWVAIAIHPN